MNKKYELLANDTKQSVGITLYRIRALVAIGSLVAAGDLGGYIKSEKNLSTSGDAWVYGNARVSDDAQVYGNARVYGDARVLKSADTLQIGPSKSSGLFTTAHIDKKIGVRVNCGCFSGTVKEFSDAIEETHKNDQEYLEQYRLFCQLIAFNFGVTE